MVDSTKGTTMAGGIDDLAKRVQTVEGKMDKMSASLPSVGWAPAATADIKEQATMKFGITTILACACAIALSASHTVLAQTATVKTAIDASNKKFGDAVAAGDTKALGTIYTDDATVLPPNSEAVKGRQAIEGVFGGLIAAGIKGVALTAQEVEAHGDTATEIGAYSIKDGTGKEIDRGKYVAIWKRVKGQWKMHRDIWNSSLPLAAPR